MSQDRTIHGRSLGGGEIVRYDRAGNLKLLTVEQLAERWQVPKDFIWKRTREGRIPRVKIGRYYRYRLDAIEALEDAGGMDAVA